MGEVSDDIMNGIMCQVCGVWMPDMFLYGDDGETSGLDLDKWNKPPGHPRTCEDCKEEV